MQNDLGFYSIIEYDIAPPNMQYHFVELLAGIQFFVLMINCRICRLLYFIH